MEFMVPVRPVICVMRKSLMYFSSCYSAKSCTASILRTLSWSLYPKSASAGEDRRSSCSWVWINTSSGCWLSSGVRPCMKWLRIGFSFFCKRVWRRHQTFYRQLLTFGKCSEKCLLIASSMNSSEISRNCISARCLPVLPYIESS